MQNIRVTCTDCNAVHIVPISQLRREVREIVVLRALYGVGEEHCIPSIVRTNQQPVYDGLPCPLNKRQDGIDFALVPLTI